MKKKYYTGLGLIVFESIVSGAYTPIDATWFILRAGLVVVYLIAAIVDTKESSNVIAWIPIATIALSLLSVDNKYKSLEDAKLKGVKSDYVTSVKPPANPVLPNCEGLTKWRLDECQKKIEKLQLAYNVALEKYNTRILRSETKIETAKVELTFQEQIPIFIYVLFICGLSFISFAATPRAEIKQAANGNLPTIKIDKNEVVKNYLDTKGKTIETYCLENGIATSTFKRWKNNYETRMKNNETKLRLIKKETA